MLDDPAFSALAVIGVVGAVGGLLGGIFAGARRLLGTILMGVIGAVAAAAIARIAGAPPVYGVGDDFSYVYGVAGALLLSYVVGRNDRPT